MTEEGAAVRLWEAIDRSAAGRVWQPRELIYVEGEPPIGVHIVRCGHIDLVHATRNGIVKPLRTSTRGDILGLTESLTARAHVASAIARDRCETGVLSVAGLRLLLDENPDIWLSVLRLLSQGVAHSWDSLKVARRDRVCHPSHPDMTSVMP